MGGERGGGIETKREEEKVKVAHYSPCCFSAAFRPFRELRYETTGNTQKHSDAENKQQVSS